MNSAFAARSSGVAITTNWMARSSPNVLYAHWRIDMIVFVDAMPLFAIRILRISLSPPRSFTYFHIFSSRSAAEVGASMAVATAFSDATPGRLVGGAAAAVRSTAGVATAGDVPTRAPRKDDGARTAAAAGV